MATIRVRPESGFGPAAVAIVTWLAVVLVGSWVAVVEDGATGRYPVGAVMLASVLAGGFVVSVESAWAFAFPALAVMGALDHKRVERLTRERGLQGVTRRRRRTGCTRSRTADPRSDNLVHRQFRPDGPNRLCVQDVNQHRTSEGWVYLVVVNVTRNPGHLITRETV